MATAASVDVSAVEVVDVVAGSVVVTSHVRFGSGSESEAAANTFSATLKSDTATVFAALTPTYGAVNVTEARVLALIVATDPPTTAAAPTTDVSLTPLSGAGGRANGIASLLCLPLALAAAL
eukprot:1131397-Prorocentrum_minimum.AAC.1